MNNPELDTSHSLEVIMSMQDGMLSDVLQDLQQRFPDERINISQLNMVYLAAKSSMPKLYLCALNETGSRELQNYLANVQFDEADGQTLTPLTMAAMSGNVAYVKTLLSHYDIDLERECNVIFDGLVVYGATALWVAAGMGHLQIVKMLVKRGADVNHNTKAQSSPLRAACYEGRLDIVRYLIEHGADVNATNAFNNTCIMIAAYKGHSMVVDTLLKHGAHTNEQALCGATALHYAAESGHLEVVELLLDHGANLYANELGITPALQAAERLHEPVVELFLGRPGLMSRESAIETLELLGATYANDKFRYNVNKAFEYLMRAMSMRYEDPQHIIRKRVMAPIPAYDDWFETENIPELQAIRLNHHSIHMESLTIRERILGRRNPELAQAIIYRGAVMADQGRFEQCQTLWNYAIDLRMVNNITVERDLLRFAQLFSQILRVDGSRLSFDDVLPVLSKCQQEIESNKYKIKNPTPNTCPRLLVDHNEQNVVTALYLIKIITHIARCKQNDINMTQIKELFTIILKYIKCDTRLADGQTLLHLAVNGVTPVDDFYTNEICKFPCYRTTMLLVHVGASVSAVDISRNTPLHTLVSKLRTYDNACVQIDRIIKILIEAGAHLDAVNDQGLTPAKACANATFSNLLLAQQNTQTSLKCIAARTIAFQKIKYKGLIPTALEAFIQMHSAEKLCS